MENYPINDTQKHTEFSTIRHILHNIKYDPTLIDHLNSTNWQEYKPHTQSDGSNIHKTQQKIKWATFTYMGKCTTYITKLFRNTNIKVAYKTNNTIGKILTNRTLTQTLINSTDPAYTSQHV